MLTLCVGFQPGISFHVVLFYCLLLLHLGVVVFSVGSCFAIIIELSLYRLAEHERAGCNALILLSLSCGFRFQFPRGRSVIDCDL